MKNERVIIGLAIACLVAGALLLACAKTATPPTDSIVDSQAAAPPAAKITEIKKEDGTVQPVLVYQDEKGVAQELELTPEQKSFAILAKSFLEFTGDKALSKADFVAFLENNGLQIDGGEDHQEKIEDMTVIRTRNSLPGVRYIHAQWIGEIGGAEELQHFSFEIEKGEEALDGARELLAKVLPIGKPSDHTDEDFVLFRHNGYVIWARRLTWDFMHHHPYNAYSREEIGNVRIAIERDIH